MLTVKKLSKNQVEEVYQNHLVFDFIPQEQKPLSIILNRMESSQYFCYGLFNEEEMTGYAFFACCDETDYILIDYFAICKGNRSLGYGETFLKLLKKELAMYQGIIFEVESGKSAKDEEELSICQRRLAFYRRCGLKDTRVKVDLFGVDMTVLLLPMGKRPSDRMLQQSLDQIYDAVFGEEIHKKYVITGFE